MTISLQDIPLNVMSPVIKCIVLCLSVQVLPPSGQLAKLLQLNLLKVVMNPVKLEVLP